MGLLLESFRIRNGKFRKKDGSLIDIAYIDPQESESTYPYKDVIKNKYRAVWLNSIKAWGWFVGRDDSVYRDYIGPCIEYLRTVTKDATDYDSEDIVAVVDRLISEIHGSGGGEVSVADTGNKPMIGSSEEVEERLKRFKEELVACMSTEEFERLIGPIIKFKRAQGYNYSWGNSILIWIQDPEAVMVKSRGRWRDMNRDIQPGAPSIWMWVPKGKRAYTKEEQEAVKAKYLKMKKKKSESELYPGERDELKVLLRRTKPTSFELMPNFFDYRFTTQMEGKEDLVGNPNTEDIPWFTDEEETEETIKYINIMKSIINSFGIRIEYVDDMGGARGCSMSGVIKLPRNLKNDVGGLNTIIHEFAHELLHQTYAKSKNENLAEYFVGTEEGRNKVEQQAELCSWTTLKFLGYSLKTNINYIGIWGADKNNAISVFDTVSKLANTIYTWIMERDTGSVSDTLNESMSESAFNPGQISGRQLAELVGCGEVYDDVMAEKDEVLSEAANSFYKTYQRLFKSR